MHTPLCRHATGEPVEMAERAVAAGLDEIGFSDHSPMPADGFDDWRMDLRQLEEYVKGVERARTVFPNLTIRLGLEVDYMPGQENWIRKIRQMHPWDYFIGSVHYVDSSWALDNPNMLTEWERRGKFEVWAAYFERLTAAAQSGLFEIIGHADLCKKFGFYPEQDCSDLYRRFVSAAAAKGVAIELNTAGLRKPCREIYPGPQLLKLARAAGVRITFGSDAHAPSEVGADLDAAVRLAKETGYTETLRFSKGTARVVPL